MTNVPHPRRRRRQGQARAGARRPQRADGGRPGHRRHAHRARRADHQARSPTRAARSSCSRISAGPRGAIRKEFAEAGRARRCRRSIRQPVAFADDCIGEAAAKAVAAMKDGDILLLENTRFHKGEEKNDPAFVAALAKLGDIYVNDAFSAAHRAHASTEGLGHCCRPMPAAPCRPSSRRSSKALGSAEAAGGRDRRRRQGLDQARPARQSRDQGRCAGHRRRHGQHLPARAGHRRRQVALRARPRRHRARIMAKAASRQLRHRPAGRRRGRRASSRPMRRRTPIGVDAMPADDMILDVGPQSIARINAAIDDAATLVWNGPLGAFEMPPFDRATVAAAKHAAERTKARQAALGRRRRRHGRGAQPCRRGRAISPMSRPPAARSSNGWRASRCPASRSCKIR